MNRVRTLTRTGVTIIELILALTLGAAFILVLVNYHSQLASFIRHTSVEQSLAQDARRCTDLITRALSNAAASTIVISTPPDPGAPPYSRVNFLGIDRSSYTITWSATPSDTIHLIRWQGATAQVDTVIASHATSLMFFLNDFRDPSIVRFTLHLQNNQQGADLADPTPGSSILVSDQWVRPGTRL